jgi:hypothetical protein
LSPTNGGPQLPVSSARGRALDLHDVGAEVSEEHRAVRAREQEHNPVDRYLQL